MEEPQDPTTPGWYTDPSDPTRQRYWDTRWTRQTRTAGMPPSTRTEAIAPDPAAPAGRHPVDARTIRIRRGIVVAASLLVLVVVGIVVWWVVGGDDGVQAPKENQLEGLVYEFVSPQVPCCATERHEGTSEFTVDGPWRVEWKLQGEGEPCSVIGRVVDPRSNRFADLQPFGSGPTGVKTYRSSGTYTLMLQYDCPDESVTGAQVRVFEGGV